MLQYKVEFRLDHAPDPIEFDLVLSQMPSEVDLLAIVVHKLKPHAPAPRVASASARARLMQDNGILSISLFDEKGTALLAF